MDWVWTGEEPEEPEPEEPPDNEPEPEEPEPEDNNPDEEEESFNRHILRIGGCDSILLDRMFELREYGLRE